MEFTNMDVFELQNLCLQLKAAIINCQALARGLELAVDDGVHGDYCYNAVNSIAGLMEEKITRMAEMLEVTDKNY